MTDRIWESEQQVFVIWTVRKAQIADPTWHIKGVQWLESLCEEGVELKVFNI